MIIAAGGCGWGWEDAGWFRTIWPVMPQLVPVLALLAITVAGCSDGANSGPRPLPSLTTPSPTQTTSAPDPKAEAEAAARAYYEAVNEALGTGDVAALELRSTPGCNCRALVDYIKTRFQTGSLHGARYAIHRVESQAPNHPLVVVVVYDASAYEERDASGRVVKAVPAVPNGQKSINLVRTPAGALLVARIVSLD